MVKVIRHSIDNVPVAALWRGFLAGAAAFGAELPSALSASALDDIDAQDIVARALAEIANACASRGQCLAGDEIVPAGFEITLDPCGATIAFGSGRSAIVLVLDPRGKSRIDVGLRFADDEMVDAAGARESAQKRYDVTFAATFTSMLTDTQKATIDALIDDAVHGEDDHDARYRLARLASDAAGLGDALDTRDERVILAAHDRVLAARDALEEES